MINKETKKVYSIIFNCLLVLFLSIPFILNALTNQVYKEVKNVELNQNQKLPSFEGGNCLYKVSEVQRWIDEYQLELEIVSINEKINLLDSPKNILCLGKIIGSEQNQSAKLNTLEDNNLIKTETIIIEDSAVGVMAGIAADVKVIGLTAGGHWHEKRDEKELLEAGAFAVTNDYKKVFKLIESN